MPQTPSKAAEHAWILLLRAQTLLLARVEAALKAARLPPLSWYDVLLELSRDPDHGLRQFEIGERMLLSKHNVSRLLDRLVAEGLVQRRVCESDGRGNEVVITDQGRALQRRMWPVYAGAIKELIDDPLTPEQVRTLADTMTRILQSTQARG